MKIPSFSVHSALLLAVGCSSPGGEPPSIEKPEPAEAAIENGSFQAELNGFLIHYEIHGRGPVLMVVPNSWGITVGGLRGIFRGLEERLTLVYFDPRGMGASAPIREDSGHFAPLEEPRRFRDVVYNFLIAN